MQFIDTHIHLQDFKSDFAPMVLNNSDAQKLVLVSATSDDFAKIAQFLRKFSDKFVGAFGIHPWYYRQKPPLEEMRKMLRLFPNALVGEIGVDELKETVCDKQHELFSVQLEVAREFSRPVIVHAAKAFSALVEHERELKQIKFSHHGFVKNTELIKFINKCGGYIGLGALFLKQEKAREMWKMMPLDKILFETDAPFRVNEENYNQIVQDNLLRLADIAELDPDVLAQQLLKNAQEFLKVEN